MQVLGSDLEHEARSALQRLQATEHVDLIEVENGVLADYLPQKIWIVSASDRRLLYANPSFHDFAGSREHTRDGLAAIFHGDDLVTFEDAFETVERHGRIEAREIRLLRHDGIYLWHKIKLVPVRRAGVILEWVVTASDIDNLVEGRRMLRETTELLALAQESAGAGTWDWDLRSGTVRLSGESARLHGLGHHPAEMDLAGWSEVVDADDAVFIIANLQAAIDTKTTTTANFASIWKTEACVG